MLWRVRWRRHPTVTSLVVVQEGVPELSSFLEHWINLFFEISFLLGEFVVVIDVLHHPCIGSRRPTPIIVPTWSGPAKRCSLGVDQPTIFLAFFGLDTGILFSSDTAIVAQVIDIIDHWFSRFCEIAHIGRPVVHLKVNVEVVISVPRWIVYSIPDSLQVSRKSISTVTRRTDEEVTSVLEEEFL